VRSDRFTAAAGILSLAIGVAAQSPETTQRPVFTAAVDVVTVDVNVVDKNGRPVEDLGRDDFELSVDGQVRTISSAQFVSVKPEPATTTTTAMASLPDFSTNTVQSGRLIGLVIDRGSIAPVRSRDVLAAAARFIEKLDPSDRVALFSIPTGPTIDFTTDHRAIEAAVRQIDGQGDSQRGAMNIGIAEALAFETNNTFVMEQVSDRECGEVGGRGGGASEVMMCNKMLKEDASIVANYAHDRARNTMNGLRAILERLGSSEMPKTLVLVSEALVIDNERRVVEGFSRAAAAAHATLYALKPEPSETDASEARLPGSRARDRAVREEGLQFVSAAGGGELFRVIADPDFAFARVASELSGYYLLTFEPRAGDRDGKPHAIAVKVRRDGVSVRSRREFGVRLARNSKSEKDAIADLLRTPVAATGIPLTLTTYVFQDPGSLRVRVLVATDVESGPDPGDRLAVGMVLLDEKGSVVASFYQPQMAPSPQSPPGSQRFFTTLLAQPGPYTLRVAVSEASGLSGSVERHVRAYVSRLGPFRASELMIGDDQRDSATAGILPSVTGEMSAGVMHTYLELFAEAPAMFDRASVTLEAAATPESPALEAVAARLQVPDSDLHSRAAAAAIPLAPLAAGTYVARAVISVDGRPVGTMTRAFRVVR
jgi:VWFA-related protein